jgi:hypothetical protein
MIDDDTLKQLLQVNDELLQLCKFLNEKRDMATSSRLIPLLDDLTHIQIEAARTNCTDAMMTQPYKGYFIDGYSQEEENRQLGNLHLTLNLSFFYLSRVTGTTYIVANLLLPCSNR